MLQQMLLLQQVFQIVAADLQLQLMYFKAVLLNHAVGTGKFNLRATVLTAMTAGEGIQHTVHSITEHLQ
jgi:hypothetical protein